jgi:cytochrome c oxidase subunit 4
VDVHLPAGVFDVDQGLVALNLVAPEKEQERQRQVAQVLRFTQDDRSENRGDDTMHDVAKHDDSKGQYFWVWGALLVLTGIEVWLGYYQIFQPVRMLEALLVLSVIKSALIIAYFMHLKFETALMRWMIVISVAGLFVIMYFFFFPDAGRIIHLGVK